MSNYQEWVSLHPLPRDRRRLPTVSGLAERVRAGEKLTFAVREFLDELAFVPDPDLAGVIAERPQLTDDRRVDAYLGGLAEHPATRAGLPVPPWAGETVRFLDHFWFVGASRGLRAYVLARSPMSFRRRGIFLDPAALVRV